MTLYVLKVWNAVNPEEAEPDVLGPFNSDTDRIFAASREDRQMESDKNLLFRVDVNPTGYLSVSTFTHQELVDGNG